MPSTEVTSPQATSPASAMARVCALFDAKKAALAHADELLAESGYGDVYDGARRIVTLLGLLAERESICLFFPADSNVVDADMAQMCDIWNQFLADNAPTEFGLEPIEYVIDEEAYAAYLADLARQRQIANGPRSAQHSPSATI